jgi:hypothetical protein
MPVAVAGEDSWPLERMNRSFSLVPELRYPMPANLPVFDALRNEDLNQLDLKE